MIRPACGTNDSERDVPPSPDGASGLQCVRVSANRYFANLGNSDSIIYAEMLPGVSDDTC